MIFDRLANQVVKNHNWIIALWMVILIVSVPLTLKVNDVLVYDESKAGGDKLDTESSEAADIVNREFPSSTANSSLIIVVQGNVSTPAVRDFLISAEQKVRGDARMRGLENFTSIYSVYRQVMEQTAMEIPPALGGLEANLTSVSFMTQYVGQWGGMNGTLMLVWGLPSMYAQARDGVNGSAMMVYGIPSMYAQAWDGVNGSAMMVYGIPSMYAQAWDGVNGSAFMLYGLPDLFQQAWSGTNMTAFMWYGIPSAYELAFEGNNRTASLLYGGPAAFLDSWLGLGLIADNGTRNLEAYNQSWQALNSTIADEGQRPLLQGYQLSFYHHWDETFNSSNASAHLPDSTPPDQRAQLSAGAVAPPYFGFASPANETQQAMADVFRSFSVGNFTNCTLMSRYTNATTWQRLISQMGGMRIDSGQLAMLRGYYDAFASGWESSLSNPSAKDLDSYARADYVIGQVAVPYLSQISAENETFLNMSLGVLDFFDLSDWNNESLLNVYTDRTFSPQLLAMAGGTGIPPGMGQQLDAYYAMFYSNWNASFKNASLSGEPPPERASSVAGQTLPAFIEQVSASNATAGSMLQAVSSSFNLTNYYDLGVVSSVANGTFYANMQAMAGSFGLTPEQLEGLLLYYDLFQQAWNVSLSNTSLNGSSTSARAKAAVDIALPRFVAMTASNDSDARATLEGIHDAFNLISWSDPVLVSSFANSTFYTGLQETAGSFGLPPEQLQGLNLFYDMFYRSWLASLTNDSLKEGPTALRTRAAIDLAFPQYLAVAAAGNTTIQAMLTGVHEGLGPGNWSNASVIDSLTNASFYNTMQAMSGSFGLPAEMTQGLLVYYGLFYGEWQASYSNATFAPATSLERAIYAVGRAVPRFASTGGRAGAIAAATYRHFNYALYSDAPNSTLHLNEAALAETRVIMSGYLAAGRLPADGQAVVRSNLDMFAGIWNRTFQPGDTLYLPPSSALEARAASAIDNATKSLFPTAGGSGGAGGGSFNLTALADPGNARNLTIDMFLGGLAGRITVQRSFLVEIYDSLGAHPDAAQARALVAGLVNSTTFGSYPIKLPGNTDRSFVNTKNNTMVVSVTFSTKSSEAMAANIDALRAILSSGRDAAGVRTYVTGDAAVGNELQGQAFKDVERIDPVTVGIVILLVGLFFLSLVTPLFPFIGIGTAVLASQALLFIIGTLIASIYYATNILLFVVLMGTGMDYGIFILARYREERRGGHSKEDAVHTSVTWAGESIATSGLAVMIGFGAMSISEFSMLKTMGIILALAIGIGILAAITFVPSVIMVVGDRIFWPSNRRLAREAQAANGGGAGVAKKGAWAAPGKKARKAGPDHGKVFYFSRAVDISLKHPWAIVGICLLLFIPSLYLWFTLTPSFDFFEGLPRTEATEGLDALGAGFGKGDIMPSQVVVQLREPVYLGGDTYDTAVLDSIDNLTRRLENITVKDDQGNSIKIIRTATPSTYYLGERLDRVDWQLFGEAAKNATILKALGKGNRTALISVVFDREPFQKESLDAVPVIRQDIADSKKADAALARARILTGGTTPGMYDVRKITDDSMTTMRIFVVVGIFILLLVVMGSLLIPLTAILSITISVSWTISATMLIFQFQRGIHVLWLVPLVLFVVLMGLGMDYNIFLITRVREEVGRGLSHDEAIRRSVERTGGIITILGMIMAGAFGSMMLSSLGLLQQFGFALFFAIVLDAFVVRIYLMPALLKIMGKWSWYAPGRLQRVRIGENGRGGEVRGAVARNVNVEEKRDKEEPEPEEEE